MNLIVRYRFSLLSIGALVLGGLALMHGRPADASSTTIIFPVIGKYSFSDDYSAPRASGPHHAIDIIADKHQPLVSVVDGTIDYVVYPKADWGYSITIRSKSGYKYRYIHMNDDTPGTNDGKGGGKYAYAVGMKEGDKVSRGQLIGWVGDSGFSNGVSHLHFEKYDPDGNVVNPYSALVAATHITTPNPAPQQLDEVLPNGSAKFGINVAVGNLEGDAWPETVTGNHVGGEPRVRVYDHLNAQLHTFVAYEADFKGGTDVTTGDIDGDGTDEIITGPGKNHDPLVKIFQPDGTPVGSFQAYDLTFQGGVRVAAGDIDGDGTDEIITGEKAGDQPRVRIFKADGTQLFNWMAMRSDFTGGIDVAAGDLDSDGNDEIVTGTSAGGAPYVKIYEPNGTPIKTFLAYASGFLGGVQVSVGDIRQGTSSEEIVTVPMARYVPAARMFDINGNMLDNDFFWEEWWNGYYDIGAGDGISRGATGVNRRSSVRNGVD